MPDAPAGSRDAPVGAVERNQRLGLTIVALVLATETVVWLLTAVMPGQYRLFYALLAGDPPVVFGCWLATRGGAAPARPWLASATAAFAVVTLIAFGDFTGGFGTGSQRLSTPLMWQVAAASNLIGFGALAWAAGHVSARGGRLTSLARATLAVIAVVAGMTLTRPAWGPGPSALMPLLNAAMFACTAAYLLASLPGRARPST